MDYDKELLETIAKLIHPHLKNKHRDDLSKQIAKQILDKIQGIQTS